MPILQKLSHGTRAYIFNSNGLPGIFLEMQVMNVLKDADENGFLETARKSQEFDIEIVVEDLGKV